MKTLFIVVLIVIGYCHCGPIRGSGHREQTCINGQMAMQANCAATCQHPNGPPKCTFSMVTACKCNRGYILSDNDNKRCVRRQDCKQTWG